jgi:hypothetical protein
MAIAVYESVSHIVHGQDDLRHIALGEIFERPIEQGFVGYWKKQFRPSATQWSQPCAESAGKNDRFQLIATIYLG